MPAVSEVWQACGTKSSRVCRGPMEICSLCTYLGDLGITGGGVPVEVLGIEKDSPG